MNKNYPELLAPVGTPEMLLAAIHGRAGAVYVGAPEWNARGRTEDLDWETLGEMRRQCAQYNVRFFFALNIVIFEEEIRAMPEYLEKIIGLAPDALIVQDVGLIHLIKQLFPEQEVHASTQMTVTSAEAIQAYSPFGIPRFVLARELSLAEIQAIRQATSQELEVFIHGALCVSYSGQCLTSESFGGRSANRGQCAQSCRLDYQLYQNGEKVDLKGRRFLVSPKDLCSLNEVEELAEMGIESLKIEGRLKTPAYVSAVLEAYHQRLQQKDNSTEQVRRLHHTFSRGFYSGWLHGVAHQKLMDGFYSAHIGEFIGKIHSLQSKTIWIKTSAEIFPGDGLLFSDRPSNQEAGSRVHKIISVKKGLLGLQCDPKFIPQKHMIGWDVFINNSPQSEKHLKQKVQDKNQHLRISLNWKLSGKQGTPLELHLTCPTHQFQAKACTTELLEESIKNPWQLKFLQKAVQCGEPWQSEALDVQLQENLFIPQKWVKDLKNQLLDSLANHLQPSVPPKVELLNIFPEKTPSLASPAQAKITVLIRSLDQIEALEGLDIHRACIDFEYGVSWSSGIKRLQAMGITAGIATPRIMKPGEQKFIEQIVRIAPDFVLVRNAGAWEMLKSSGLHLVGDSSLNICNSLSAQWFHQQGLKELTPSFDLNRQQMMSLLSYSQGDKFEVCIQHYMPAFHMEHCVFASCLSQGDSVKNCGTPCRKNQVEIADHKGEKHFLVSDPCCRNTMFKGKPQNALRLLPEFCAKGVQNFRLEALYESPSQLRNKLLSVLEYRDGKIDIQTALARLDSEEKFGVSEGQLLNNRTWKNRKKN